MLIGPLLLSLSVAGEPPRPAPPRFVTINHGLTFASPKGAFYCRLQSDWAGSDHGTVLFLAPPRACGETGYASSGRSFLPGNLPLISVYYGYDPRDGELDPPARPRCHVAGIARFLGSTRRLCRSRSDGMITIDARAFFKSDLAREADFTLYTTPARLWGDLATLRSVLASVRTCTATYIPEDDQGRRASFSVTNGRGPPCPRGARFF